MKKLKLLRCLTVSDVCDMGRTPRIQKFTWNDDGTPNFGTPVAAGEPLAVPSRDGGE